jgi:two-component system response regulator HydG
MALIQKALVEAKGNKTKAAELLGISRRTLHRKLKSHE